MNETSLSALVVLLAGGPPAAARAADQADPFAPPCFDGTSQLPGVF